MKQNSEIGRMMHPLYQELKGLLKQRISWTGHKDTFHTLVSMMLGIFLCRDVRSGKIASKSGLSGQIESIEQRYRRWLKNPRIKARTIVDPIAKQLLFSRKKRWIRLQIDRTIIDGGFNVLMVTFYHRRRAIPLAWTILPHSGSCSQKDWKPLLKRVNKMISKRSRILVLGDREFGTVDLMRFCQTMGWFFDLRVKRTYTVANPHQGFPLQWKTLGSLLAFRAQVRFIRDWLYVQDEFFRVNFVLTCAEDSDDPWILATNLPPTQRVIEEYKRRFGCEEFFSDMKARGFDVEKTQLRHADRFDRLLIVLVLLAFWLWSTARRLFVTRQIRSLVGQCHQHRYSHFQLAYRWLERQITNRLSIIPDPQYQFGLFA